MLRKIISVWQQKLKDSSLPENLQELSAGLAQSIQVISYDNFAGQLHSKDLLLQLTTENLVDFSVANVLSIKDPEYKTEKKEIIHNSYRLHSDLLRALLSGIPKDFLLSIFEQKFQAYLPEIARHLNFPQDSAKLIDVKCFSQSPKNMVYAVTIQNNATNSTVLMKYSSGAFGKKNQVQNEIFINQVFALVKLPYLRVSRSSDPLVFFEDYIDGDTTEQLRNNPHILTDQNKYKNLVRQFAQYAAVSDIVGKGDRRPNFNQKHSVQGNYMFDLEGRLWVIDNDYLFNTNTEHKAAQTLLREASQGIYETGILLFSDNIVRDSKLFREVYLDTLKLLKIQEVEICQLLEAIYEVGQQLGLIKSNINYYYSDIVEDGQIWIDTVLAKTKQWLVSKNILC